MPLVSSLRRVRTVIWRIRNPRPVIGYCVGFGKSGTHSIDRLVKPCLRSAHEPEASKTIDLLLAKENGEIDARSLRIELVKRDRRLWLGLESSLLLVHFIEELLAIHPEAKFVLTIRHPFDTLNSSWNHLLELPVGPFDRYAVWLYGPDRFCYDERERHLLEGRQLPSAKSILAAWSWHNQTVLKIVPEKQLLVVRTKEISARWRDILEFLGCKPAEVATHETHAFSNRVDHGLAKQLPISYLLECLGESGGQMMDQYFEDSGW